MCRAHSFAGSLLGLSLLFLPSLAFTQSFEDGKTYQVTGAQLNRLSQDLQTASDELTASKAELIELQKQLVTVSLSLRKSERETAANELAFGAGGLVIGAMSGALLYAYLKPH